MLVVACVKQVPDTTQVKIDPVTGTLIREGVPFIVNPFDTQALEESLRLKDKYGFHVAVISMGPPNTEVTLRKTLALGADEAVLLSDRAFGGADTLATSMASAKAIQLASLSITALSPVSCSIIFDKKVSLSAGTFGGFKTNCFLNSIGPGTAIPIPLISFNSTLPELINSFTESTNCFKSIFWL